jgi:hypothetical protein
MSTTAERTTRRPSGGQRTAAARVAKHRAAHPDKRRYEASIDRDLADWADQQAADADLTRAQWLERELQRRQQETTP